MKKKTENRFFGIGMTVAAAFVSAALILGGCTPSGNLASEEHEQAAKAVTETPAPTVTATPTPAPTATLTPTPSPTPAITATPTPIPAVTMTPIPAAENAYYTIDTLNVRSEASADSELLGQIDEGTRIVVLEIVDESWARFEFQGQTAYVSMGYLVAEAQYDPSDYYHDDDSDDNEDEYDEVYIEDDENEEVVVDDGTEEGAADDNGSGDGDTGDGGASDGGTEDGEASDGGAEDGDAEDGGASDGGSDDGGAGDAGSDDGDADDEEIFDEVG